MCARRGEREEEMGFTQIIIRHMLRSEALSERIHELSEELQGKHPEITLCRVVVESEGNHRHKGRPYLVSVNVRLPHSEIVADRHEHEDVYVALRDAFAAVEHQFAVPERLAA